jgi:hypothetical protein
MKGKTLLILVVLAVVLVGLAVLTSRREASSTPAAAGKLALPDLPVNDVRKIVLTDGASTATVARVNDVWVSADKYGYPADFEKVRAALLKLSEMKVGQVMKIDEDQRARLKMAPPAPGAAAGTAGTLVELRGENDLIVGSLLLGATRTRKASGGPMAPQGGFPDGQYVSPDQGRTVYLVADVLDDLSVSPKQWLNTELTSVTVSDVDSVTIQHPDEAPLALIRPEDGADLQVQGLSKKEETDSSKTYGVASALSYLRLDDVADPALTNEALGFDKPVVYTATTKKGEVFTVTLGASPQGDSGRYARIAVALSPREPKTVTAGADKPAEAAGADTNAVAQAEAAKKAEDERKLLEEQTAELNARLSPWTYIIASYKADAMAHKRDSLVKAKEKEKKKTEEKD